MIRLTEAEALYWRNVYGGSTTDPNTSPTGRQGSRTTRSSSW